ncbi:MAB_1171c family putative transporter [Streptomyces chartreusis]
MDQIKDWTFLSCAATCLAACIYMSLGLRTNRRDRALLMLTAAFGFKFVSLTIAAPDVAAAADRLIGIPDLTALVVHLFGGVGSSTGILAALSYWTCPAEQARQRVKCWLVIAAVMAGALIGLWLAARPAVSNRSGNYLLDNMQLPQVAVYLVLYTVAFAAGLLEILVICVRYARLAPGVWLRRGLRITAIGAAVYLLYCGYRLICVTAVHLRVDLPDLEFITPVCIGAGVPLMAIGLTLPSWGAKLTAASAWLHDYRSYQALYPLWRELYDQVPSIALDPPRSRIADILRFREIGYHLCRRVIEINDGRLALGSPTAAVQAQAPVRSSSDLADEVERLVQMSRRTRAA